MSLAERRGLQSVILLGAIASVLAVIAIIAISGNAQRGLRADILGPRRVEPGQPSTYSVSVRDTAGSVVRVELDFGDGDSTVLARRTTARCQPGPLTEQFDADHTYATGGVFTARAEVVTGGCDAPREQVEAVRTVQVKALRR